ncbi:hypothetical protein KBB49_04035 [Candidatus Saccharibacteria bacterium]|nr:hypothetical protein [Candidatus Saccharibacteria bacterium]
MKSFLIIFWIALLLVGCDRNSSPLAQTPEFELREFVVKEEKTEATSYAKEWNRFKGTGTLIARNVTTDRNMLVWLEVRDKTLGQDSEPHIVTVLFRGGIGKVEVSQSKYGEMSSRPNYEWIILGWQEFNKANITVIGVKD